MKLFGKILLALLTFNAYALSEKEHQDRWCTGEKEVIVEGGRIDCLTELYAIEIDFAYKRKVIKSTWST